MVAPCGGPAPALVRSAWAEQTERVELTALVSAAGYRNPDLLADMARTVDHISGVRLILGVGAGWHRRDHSDYGFELGTPRFRLDRLTAYLERIEHRLALLNPPAVRQLPIMIGGGGQRRTLSLVARHADIWHVIAEPGTAERKAGILAEHCEAIGRRVEEIEFSTHVTLDSDGAPDLAAAEALWRLGFALFTIIIRAPDFDLSGVHRLLRWRDGQAR